MTSTVPPEGSEALGPSRRREVGAASARSLLLTILGEFVQPAGGGVWTATVLDALAVFGVEEKAARQTLSRTASEGLLVAARHGRRTRWALTDTGAALLVAGRERIYGHLQGSAPWDGRWAVLLVPTPDERRVRAQLRTRLTWARFGSPLPGVWVVPAADQAPEAARILADLGLDGEAVLWTGPMEFGQARDLAARAWPLSEVEERYAAFVDEFEGREPADAREAFHLQVRLVQEWRRFPFLDPVLPPELLDHTWAGQRAAELFAGCHEAWAPGAWAYWEALEEQAGTRV